MQIYMYYCEGCRSLGSAERKHSEDKHRCSKCKQYMKPLMKDINEWRAMTEDERKIAIHNIADNIQEETIITNTDNKNVNDEKNVNYEKNKYYEIKDIKIDGFNNIHIKLKKLANILLAVSTVIGVISVGYYIIYYLDYISDNQASIDSIQKSIIQTKLILSIRNTFIGIVTAFVLYGFGEVIYRLIRIDNKLSK